MLVFKKQVDNLKTNHRGVYVLTDHAFRPLARMSADAGGQAVARAQPVCILTFLLPLLWLVTLSIRTWFLSLLFSLVFPTSHSEAVFLRDHRII